MSVDLTSVCWDRPEILLKRSQELSRTRGGATRKKDLGPPRWHVGLTSHPLPILAADRLYAQLLDAESSSALIMGSRSNWQPSYKASLSGVTVASVIANKLTLAGLPVGVELPIGARLSVAVASGREYFQTLDLSDTGGGFRVEPAIRTIEAGDPVELTPPILEVDVNPGSVVQLETTKHRKRVSFSGVQVIVQ